MNWILGKIKWILILAMFAGPALAYFAWTDNEHIANVEKNGAETIAVIDGATRSKKRRRAATFSVDLSWKDAQGNARTAKKISISSELAKTIIKDDNIVVDSLPIKYLENDPTIAPIVMNNVAGQIETNDFMINAGAAGGVIGFLGSIGGLLWGRRRSDA